MISLVCGLILFDLWTNCRVLLRASGVEDTAIAEILDANNGYMHEYVSALCL